MTAATLALVAAACTIGVTDTTVSGRIDDPATLDRLGVEEPEAVWRRTVGGIEVLGTGCLVDRNKIIDQGTGAAIFNSGARNDFTRNKIVRCAGHGVDDEGSGESHYERNTVILALGVGTVVSSVVVLVMIPAIFVILSDLGLERERSGAAISAR